MVFKRKFKRATDEIHVPGSSCYDWKPEATRLPVVSGARKIREEAAKCGTEDCFLM